MFSQPCHAGSPLAMKVVSAPTSALHIPSLDGLRAISILIVFFAHCGWEKTIPGGLGVTIFFFLSGYLITTLMRSEYLRNGQIHLGHFWMRRSLRILPNFYFVLVGSYLIPLVYHSLSSENLRTFWFQALHLTNYFIIFEGYSGFPAISGTGVYWSLAVEEHFYMLFPLLFIAMQRCGLQGRGQALLLAALCLLDALWRLHLIQVGGSAFQSNRTYMASDTRVDSILFGCIAAVWFNPALDGERLQESTWKFLLFPLGLGLMLISLGVRDPVFRESVRYSVQGVSLMLIFNAAIRFPGWSVFRWLNNSRVRFLGALSYSFYLVHFTVIGIMQAAWPTASKPVIALVSLMATLFVSCGLYYGIEKPCARLRHRYID